MEEDACGNDIFRYLKLTFILPDNNEFGFSRDVCLSVHIRILESVLGTGSWGRMCRAFDSLEKTSPDDLDTTLPLPLVCEDQQSGFCIGKLYTILNFMWLQCIENH